ncbi:MAG: cytochrome c1 [Thiothrix nivea]|nr:MAG: cytochrome c1 [Thiothrix nivea]
MKKFIASVMFALSAAMLPVSGVMASANVALEDADIDIHNKSSLQRGAKYFVNYCMGCHSLDFSRYNRVAKDLELTDKQVMDNLIFTRTKGDPTKVGELMKNGMTAEYGEAAFGSAPPDLSLVGRSRGGDWIYSFLKAFYLDPSRPLGVNNAVFENAGMPHVLWELQGWQEAETHDDGHGHVTKELKLVEKGSVSPAEYNQVVRDLTNFLVYVSEPAQLHRKMLGVWVLLFLVVFAVVAYFLKKEYWRDVH